MKRKLLWLCGLPSTATLRSLRTSILLSSGEERPHHPGRQHVPDGQRKEARKPGAGRVAAVQESRACKSEQGGELNSQWQRNFKLAMETQLSKGLLKYPRAVKHNTSWGRITPGSCKGGVPPSPGNPVRYHSLPWALPSSHPLPRSSQGSGFPLQRIFSTSLPWWLVQMSLPPGSPLDSSLDQVCCYLLPNWPCICLSDTSFPLVFLYELIYLSPGPTSLKVRGSSNFVHSFQHWLALRRPLGSIRWNNKWLTDEQKIPTAEWIKNSPLNPPKGREDIRKRRTMNFRRDPT